MMGQLLPAAKQVQGARPRADGDACTRRLANPSQAQRRSPGSERRRAWRRGFPRSEETEHQSRGSAASGFGLKFCGSLKALAALTQRELEDASGWWLCWGPRGEARGPRRPSAWTICREKVCVAGKSRGRGRERRPYRVRAAGGVREAAVAPGLGRFSAGAASAREAGERQGRAGKRRAAQGPRCLGPAEASPDAYFPQVRTRGAGPAQVPGIRSGGGRSGFGAQVPVVRAASGIPTLSCPQSGSGVASWHQWLVLSLFCSGFLIFL